MLNNIVRFLLILAGLELGLLGAFEFSLLAFIFQMFPVYVLRTFLVIIGVAAVYKAIDWGSRLMK